MVARSLNAVNGRRRMPMNRWRDTAPGAPFGIAGDNRRLSFRLLHVFEMAPDGLIRRENVWIDFASIMRQLAPSPAAS
jgi:uncharacterized protein